MERPPQELPNSRGNIFDRHVSSVSITTFEMFEFTSMRVVLRTLNKIQSWSNSEIPPWINKMCFLLSAIHPAASGVQSCFGWTETMTVQFLLSSLFHHENISTTSNRTTIYFMQQNLLTLNSFLGHRICYLRTILCDEFYHFLMSRIRVLGNHILILLINHSIS